MSMTEKFRTSLESPQSVRNNREVWPWAPPIDNAASKQSRAAEWRGSVLDVATGQWLLNYLNSFLPSGTQNAPSWSNNIMGGNSAIVDGAKTFLKTPYLMWGQDKSGIDCSGLVVEAMKLAGKPIQDTTAADMKSKTPTISAAEAQPGDLLCWADGSHVEIVISASGNQVTTIWSASSKGWVGEHSYDLGGKEIHKNTLWDQGGMPNSPNQMAA